MRKKKWVAGTAVFLLFLLAACGSVKEENRVSEENEKDLQTVSETAFIEQEETKAFLRTEGVTGEIISEKKERKLPAEALRIYYGNPKADGLNVETVEVEAVLPQTIIDCLAGYNIVSIDTRVNYFETDEEEGKVILYLDLSKAFGGYLKTMGTDGERVIIAALTNTFLEAYGAQELMLTVGGSPLKTDHADYDGPLTYRESLSEMEPSSDGVA